MRHGEIWLGTMTLATLLLSGCRVEKARDGASEKMSLATPFGGLQVKTNESAAENGIGVPVYPGSSLVKKSGKDNNNGAADINLNLGVLRMRIKVLSYRTDDAPEQVRSFYRKQLARYGAVITCAGDTPQGEPTRTPEGLTCEKDGKDHADGHVGGDGSLELKAGSPQHQHVVSIEKESGGTKFALVMVDLPKEFHWGDDEEKREQRQSQ